MEPKSLPFVVLTICVRHFRQSALLHYRVVCVFDNTNFSKLASFLNSNHAEREKAKKVPGNIRWNLYTCSLLASKLFSLADWIEIVLLPFFFPHLVFSAHQDLVFFSEILSAFDTIEMRRIAVFLLRQLSKLLFMCWVLKLPAFDKCSNCECINAILNNIVIHWNEIYLLLDPMESHLKWFRKMSMMLANR